MPEVLDLPKEAFDHFRAFLVRRGYSLEDRLHQLFLARGRGMVINLYLSGKLVLGGANPVEHDTILTEAMRLGGKQVLRPHPTPLSVVGPRIGTDEAGKGDYFGPLVVAGCAVDEPSQRWLVEWGVRDSKAVTDKGIHRMAGGIRELLGAPRYEVLTISPQRYNELHAEMKNVNRILGWGHARVIENLLGRNPGIPRAVADQFGDPDYIVGSLMDRGRRIELIQVPRGERDAAVAAASILARDEFLRRLQVLSQEVGSELPKGAVAVVATARRLVERYGPEILHRTAKVHFRTTERVLNRGEVPGGRKEA